MSYLDTATRKRHRDDVLANLVALIQLWQAKTQQDFDTVLVRGVSGLLVGPQVAAVLSKNLSVIRKPNDGSHSDNSLEGECGESAIIVDDLICTGDTFRQIIGQIPATTSIKAGFLYVSGYCPKYFAPDDARPAFPLYGFYWNYGAKIFYLSQTIRALFYDQHNRVNSDRNLSH